MHDDMMTVELPEMTGEVYVWNEYLSDEPPAAGDEVGHYGFHYGGRQSRHELEQRDVYLPVPYTGWGDYCGSTVERANFNALVEDFGDYVVQVGHGSHDGRGIYLKVGSEVPALLLDVIQGLRDYPLVDEEVWSMVEMEVEQDDLDSWLLDDLIREIEERQDWTDAEDHGFDRATVCQAYLDLRSEGSLEWYAETATSGHVDVAEAADAIVDLLLTTYARTLVGADNHPTLY